MLGVFQRQFSSWPRSYGSLIYNYLCNHCLSPLMLWVSISIRVRCTALCDKLCQWFSPGSPVSSTNKTDHHDITEILLKVALNTIKQTNKDNILHNKNTSQRPFSVQKIKTHSNDHFLYDKNMSQRPVWNLTFRSIPSQWWGNFGMSFTGATANSCFIDVL